MWTLKETEVANGAGVGLDESGRPSVLVNEPNLRADCVTLGCKRPKKG